MVQNQALDLLHVVMGLMGHVQIQDQIQDPLHVAMDQDLLLVTLIEKQEVVLWITQTKL